MAPRVVLLDDDVGGRDHERATRVAHGVAGVHGQVHEDLLELALVGGDRGQARLEVGAEFHVGVKGSLEQAFHVGDDLVEVDDARVDGVLAAEHQELARQLGGATGGADDLVDVLLRRVAFEVLLR